MLPAAAQLGIERVQELGIDRADLLVADQRPDVLVYRPGNVGLPV
jgi:hypothetical protein